MKNYLQQTLLFQVIALGLALESALESDLSLPYFWQPLRLPFWSNSDTLSLIQGQLINLLVRDIQSFRRIRVLYMFEQVLENNQQQIIKDKTEAVQDILVT